MQSKLNAAHFANEEAAIAYVEARLWPGMSRSMLKM
jgi:hypothetical protein